MSRKIDPNEIIEELRWIKYLPNEGGAWGRGLIATVQAAASQVSQLGAARKTLDGQINASFVMLRRKRRQAESEAKLCFSQEQIVQAQVAADNESEENKAFEEDPDLGDPSGIDGGSDHGG